MTYQLFLALFYWCRYTKVRSKTQVNKSNVKLIFSLHVNIVLLVEYLFTNFQKLYYINRLANWFKCKLKYYDHSNVICSEIMHVKIFNLSQKNKNTSAVKICCVMSSQYFCSLLRLKQSKKTAKQQREVYNCARKL